MSTITAQSIIDKAELILQDPNNVRWAVSELLGWLNDGQREIFSYRPDCANLVQSVALAAGTRQTLPTDGQILLDVRRNMGANGTTPGAAIRKVPMSLLDAQRPNWHADPQSATIKEFMYDSRTPLVFYVYPPATANTQVELVYAKPPTNVAAAANVINIDDGYANALLDYMLYRAYSKDTEDSNNEARAAAAYAAFKEGLGFKAQSDATAVAAAGVRK